MLSPAAALLAGALLCLGPLPVPVPVRGSPCPSGRFPLRQQCAGCHPSCAECSGQELFQCSTCGVDEDGEERFLHQGRCRMHCPRSFYPERAHFACRPCMANCELCTDANMCAKCQDQYKLQGGRCQAALCHKGQMRDPDTGECIDCSPGCKTCSTDDPEICNSCLDGHFFRSRGLSDKNAAFATMMDVWYLLTLSSPSAEPRAAKTVSMSPRPVSASDKSCFGDVTSRAGMDSPNICTGGTSERSGVSPGRAASPRQLLLLSTLMDAAPPPPAVPPQTNARISAPWQHDGDGRPGRRQSELLMTSVGVVT